MLLSVFALSSCANTGSGVKATVQLKIVAGDDVVYNGPVEMDYEGASLLDVVNEASASGKFDFKATEDEKDVLKCGKYEVKSEDKTEYYWKCSYNGRVITDTKAAEISVSDGDTAQFTYYVGTLNENGQYEEKLYTEKSSETTANTDVTEIVESEK